MRAADVRHWYHEWRKPSPPPPTVTPEVVATWSAPERVDRAHDAVSIFWTVVRFLAALRHPECKRFADELTLVKFEKGGAREQEMNFTQTSAFVGKALELASKGVIPIERARHMAIGIAAQFELGLRQRDIIGEWAPTEADARKARIESVRFGDKWWAGYFTWGNIPGWRWRMRTSKSKYRTSAEFDLTIYPLLFPLLEAVPHGDRVGPIVKGTPGLPIRPNRYRLWFRAIARATGIIPDNVWNMDTRAGAATEADEAGADLDAIRDALTHSDNQTTARYIRGLRTKRIASVAQARAAKRVADRGGGGHGDGTT